MRQKPNSQRSPFLNTQPPPPSQTAATSRRLLDPIDRTSEILFALIMVLTFTGTLSVVEADRNEVRVMLIGAIGCNLAWGLVDAAMYLLTIVTERRRGVMTLQRLRQAKDSTTAHGIIANALPPIVSAVLSAEQLEAIRSQVVKQPEPKPSQFQKQDFLGATAVFLWVFLTTFPVVLPFVFMGNVILALRVSNGIAIALFFVTGFALGRASGIGPWRMGLSMVAIGLVLVGITIALGG